MDEHIEHSEGWDAALIRLSVERESPWITCVRLATVPVLLAGIGVAVQRGISTDWFDPTLGWLLIAGIVIAGVVATVRTTGPLRSALAARQTGRSRIESWRTASRTPTGPDLVEALSLGHGWTPRSVRRIGRADIDRGASEIGGQLPRVWVHVDAVHSLLRAPRCSAADPIASEQFWSVPASAFRLLHISAAAMAASTVALARTGSPLEDLGVPGIIAGTVGAAVSVSLMRPAWVTRLVHADGRTVVKVGAREVAVICPESTTVVVTPAFTPLAETASTAWTFITRGTRTRTVVLTGVPATPWADAALEVARTRRPRWSEARPDTGASLGRSA